MNLEEIEKRRATQRKYYHKHKDEINTKKREQRKNDPVYASHVRDRQNAYREENKDRINELARQRYANPDVRQRRRRSHSENYWRRKEETKAELFSLLGGMCSLCGEDEPSCLDVHHNDGDNPRQEMKITDALKRWRMYLSLAREDLGSQTLLCSNCHRKYHAGVIDL